MARTLDAQINSLKPGDHLCLLYETAQEQVAAVVPFIKAGLVAGERCVYVADAKTFNAVRTALRKSGVGVEREEARGALVPLSKPDAFLETGQFDPQRMIAVLRRTEEEALALGFTGLRVVGEMTWVLGDTPGHERLLEFEALLNNVLPGSHTTALCQYATKRFSPEVLQGVLRTHPIAVIGDAVCTNPYYQPARFGRGQASAQETLDWMVATVRDIHHTQEDLAAGSELLQNIAASTSEAIYAKDVEGRYLFVNRAGAALMGKAPEELLGKQDKDFLSAEVAGRLRDAELSVMASARDGSYEETFPTAAAGTRTFLTTKAPLRDAAGVTIGIVGASRDITQLREAQASIARQAQLLQAVLDCTPDAVWALDGEGRLMLTNRVGAGYLGRPAEELVGKPIAELLGGDVAAKLAQTSAHLSQTDEPLTTDTEVELPSGKRLFQSRSARLRNAAGEVVGMVGVARDVTEERQREAEHVREEQLMRAIVDGSKDIIYAKDREGRFTMVNPAFARRSGLQQADFIGHTAAELLPAAKAADLAARELRVMATGEPMILEEEFQTPAGPGWFETLKAPLYDESGEVTGTLGISRDITLQKRSVEAIARQERLLNAIAEGTPDAVFAKDMNGNYLFANSGTARMLGRAREELLGHRIQDFLPPEMGEPLQHDDEQVLTSGEGRSFDERVNTPSGRRWFNAYKAPLRDAQGKVTGLVGVARDMTEARENEARLQERNVWLTALADAAPQFASTLDAGVLRRLLVQMCVERFGASLAGLAERQPGAAAAILAQCPEGDLYAQALEAVFGGAAGENGPVESAIATGESLVVEDITAENRFFLSGAAPAQKGFCTAAILPLRAGAETLGVLLLYGSEAGFFSPQRVSFFETLTSRAAAALLNARLFQAEQDRIERLRTLSEMAIDLASGMSKLQLAEAVSRMCVERLGAVVCAVMHVRSKGEVEVVTQYPADAQFPRDAGVRWDDTPLGQAPTGRAIRTGRLSVVEDVESDPSFALWRERALNSGIRAMAAFPLSGHSGIIGTLAVGGGHLGFFDTEHLALFSNVARSIAVATENAQLIDELQAGAERVNSLRSIDRTIASTMDLRVMLSAAVQQMQAQLRLDGVVIWLRDRATFTLRPEAASGLHTASLRRGALRLGEDLPGQVALDRRAQMAPTAGDPSQRARLLHADGILQRYAAPLIVKGQVVGVSEILSRRSFSEDVAWWEYLEAYMGQIAVAIDNAALWETLQRSKDDLVVAYDTTLEGWARALDLRDHETEGHTRRVTEVVVQLAAALGVRDEELERIRRGALLHDIGKTAISDSILLKPGPLTEEEWVEMRKHPVYAQEFLSNISYLKPALVIPYCHQERWDGSGYPRGLKGEDIPLAARIFAVVDVWDALGSRRPYKEPWTEQQTRDYLREQKGKLFDPRVVDAFLAIQIEELEAWPAPEWPPA